MDPETLSIFFPHQAPAERVLFHIIMSREAFLIETAFSIREAHW